MEAYFDLSLAGVSVGRLLFSAIDIKTVYQGSSPPGAVHASSAALEPVEAEAGAIALTEDELDAWDKELSRAFGLFYSLCHGGPNGRPLFLGARVEELLQACWIRLRISRNENLWDTHLKEPVQAVKALPFPVFKPAIPPRPNLVAERGDKAIKGHGTHFKKQATDVSRAFPSSQPGNTGRPTPPQPGQDGEVQGDVKQCEGLGPQSPDSASETTTHPPKAPVQSPLTRLDLSQGPCLARRGVIMCDPGGSELYICLGDLPWIDPRVFFPIARASPKSDVLKRLEMKATLTGAVKEEILVVGVGKTGTSAG